MKRYKRLFREASLYEVKKGEVYTRDNVNHFVVIGEVFEGKFEPKVNVIHIGSWLEAKPINHQKETYKRSFSDSDFEDMNLVKNVKVPDDLKKEYRL